MAEQLPSIGDGEDEPVETLKKWDPEFFEEIFRKIHNPEDKLAYFSDRQRMLEAGLPIWLVDDFSDPAGRMYKFYDDRKLFGFVQENYETQMANAYIYQDESPFELPNSYGSLGEAVLALKRYHATRD